MLWLGVVVGLLTVVSAFRNDPANRDLLEAVLEAGQAATKLMDFETYEDFYFVQRKIVSAVKSAKINKRQRFAALSLVWFITREIEEGKIQLRDIKSFIDFFNSGKLDHLLTTWDIRVFP